MGYKNKSIWWFGSICFILSLLAIIGIVRGRGNDRSPSVLGGGVGGDAATLNSLNSGQFIRSDATDSYTSGTLTTSVGTIFQTEGNFYTKGSPASNVKAYGATGDGVTDDHVFIEAADAAAVVAGLPVLFPLGTYRISDDMALSANCWFAEGSMLSVDLFKTVTFSWNSKLGAGLYQIFSGDGVVEFEVGCLIDRVFPQWWGATGDSVTDDTIAIQAAIIAAEENNNPLVLFFPRGRYYVSAPLVVDRRLHIRGAGYGTQIFQSADVNLFEFDPWAPGVSSPSSISDMYLGSAATTVGTSLIYFHKVGKSIIENIIMAGAYYGIHIHGSMFNTIRDCSYAVTGFFGESAPNIFSEQQIAIYCVPDGGTHCNGNVFINNSLGFGLYGLYVDENGGEGNFHWYGGRIEQGSEFGVHVEGASKFSIENLHLEGAAATCGITLKDCTNGRLIGDNYIHLNIINSRRINIVGGFYTSFNIDKWSRDIDLNGMHHGTGSISIESSTTRSSNMTKAAGDYLNVGGMSNRSYRNLVDGDLEVWDGNDPIGFTAVGTGNLIDVETGIVKFGLSSAKVLVGAANTNAILRYVLDLDRYSRMGLTNYTSSAYKWTESPSQANEYYVDLFAGGDPGIYLSPETVAAAPAGGVLVNDSWIAEGTIGGLALSEWGYGDNDALGYDTVYVRLGDDTDPDTKAVGYVQARHKVYSVTVSCWVYKPETNGANPQLTLRYNSGADGGAVVVPFDEWTRISRTFFPRSGKTVAYIDIGWLPGAANYICYIDGIEITDGETVSPIFDDSMGLNSDFRVGGRFLTSLFGTFTENDLTPSVVNGANFKTFNSIARTITMFDGGYEGQNILVYVDDGNTTVDFSGSNLKGNGGADWTPASGDHLRAIFDGTNWLCDVVDSSP